MGKAWNFKDLTGEKYGNLTPIEYLGGRKWLCKCDCGNVTEVFTNNLTRGNTTSCGCLNSKLSSKRAKTHGLSGSKVYSVAVGIIQRCYNVNNSQYMYYGGRGITVYEPWRKNVGLFAKWLLDNGWYDGCEVDKDIKGGKGYYPDTISFVSKTENARHKRSNIKITYHGITQTLKEWCVALDLPYKTIHHRYKYLGFTDPKELFETPVQIGNNQTLRG